MRRKICLFEGCPPAHDVLYPEGGGQSAGRGGRGRGKVGARGVRRLRSKQVCILRYEL